LPREKHTGPWNGPSRSSEAPVEILVSPCRIAEGREERY